MEIDITFDTYIVSNAENEFCQKKKNVLVWLRSLIDPFYNIVLEINWGHFRWT